MHPAVRRIIYPVAQVVAKPLGLHPFPKTHRHHLSNILRVLSINCVIDAGGHYGEFGQLLRGIGFQGDILSFEPASASYERLLTCAKGDKRWRAFPFGLGAENTTATMHLFNSSEFNSLLPANPNVCGRLEGNTVEVGTESISLRRLDAVFDDLQVAHPVIFLKMDTQGYDLKVVEGSLGVLSYVAAMQSELPESMYYQAQPAMLESLAYYQSLGYEPTGFFPVNHERDGLTVIEWDVVLARPSRNGQRV